jgi:LysR family transcriptional regulator, mexEF-oprN operon transcriptional activator
MNGIDPSRFDLNLLNTLTALIEESNVTRAAERLKLSQPTVSEALARLRAHFDDELLVRDGRALTPTPFALELITSLKPHLEGLLGAARSAAPFDPSTSSHVFKIGCTDAVAFAVMADLTQTLRREAPGCAMVVRTGDYRVLPGLLANGEIETALGFLRDAAPGTAKIKVVRHAPWVVLRDGSQPPLAGIDDFCERPHVLVTPLGDLSGFVDDGLKLQGRERQVRIGVSAFALLLSILPGSDLLATVPDFVAAKLAPLGGLAVDACPVAVPLVTNSLAWRAVVDRDPAERWFRAQVARAFAHALPDLSENRQ